MASSKTKMFASTPLSGLLSIVSIFTILCNINYASCKSEAFDVKPGGKVHRFEIVEGDVTCRFSYASQGGTKEAWLMDLRPGDAANSWLCSVERPGGVSYLYFQRFKLKVLGANVQSVNLQGGSGNMLLSEEYAVNYSSNYVGHIEGKFKSMLSKIELVASTTAKNEL